MLKKLSGSLRPVYGIRVTIFVIGIYTELSKIDFMRILALPCWDFALFYSRERGFYGNLSNPKFVED